MRSIVTDRVAWSVGRSVGLHSEPCKTAEPTEMPFGLRARMVSRNHVLNDVPDPPWEGAILGKGAPTVKYLPCGVKKTAQPIALQFEL